MITTDLLIQFKDTLDLCNQQVTELLQTRQKRNLFKNSEDYQTALKACQWFPSEYYKLRIFDTELTLCFNARSKKFYINCETNKYNFLHKLEFLDFIKEYNLEYNPDLSHFNIDQFKIFFKKDYDFDSIIKIFLKFCNLFLTLYIDSDKLFIYNS